MRPSSRRGGTHSILKETNQRRDKQERGMRIDQGSRLNASELRGERKYRVESLPPRVANKRCQPETR